MVQTFQSLKWDDWDLHGAVAAHLADGTGEDGYRLPLEQVEFRIVGQGPRFLLTAIATHLNSFMSIYAV